MFVVYAIKVYQQWAKDKKKKEVIQFEEVEETEVSNMSTCRE